MSLSTMLNSDEADAAQEQQTYSYWHHDQDTLQPSFPVGQSIGQEFNFDAFLQGEDGGVMPDAGFQNLDFLDVVTTWAHQAQESISTPSGYQSSGSPNHIDLTGSTESDSGGSRESDSDEDVNMEDETPRTQRSDEDVIMIDNEDDTVCYGMLYRQDVKLVSQNETSMDAKLKELAHGKPAGYIQKFKLNPNSVHILLSLPDGTQFGFLRDNMTKALEPLLEQGSSVQFEAVESTAELCQQIGRASKPDEALVHVNINVYGPPDRATEIGDLLSEHKLYLQNPDQDQYRSQYPYQNPQKLFPELEGRTTAEVLKTDVAGPAASRPRAEEERLRELVNEVQNCLTRANELQNAEGDRRLTRELLPHQKAGLTYMLQRESGDIPEKYRLWQKKSEDSYVHRVTKHKSATRPEEKGGGVLADEMGMGKSLTTLALIVQTLDEGRKWAEEQRNEDQAHLNTKVLQHSHCTLIIVPSALLINNWDKEIQRHTGNTLRVTKYHGPGRERNLDTLAKSFDVVITTYNTLAVEYEASKSILHKINWFRIVLDEAHIIRRPSTTFHKTCANLEARSRWCLTGTPIQNKLEDIGALFAFLRDDQFRSLSQFRKYICIPFEQGETQARDRLVLLYDSLCLRRTKEILRLPPHKETVRELELTADERRQYERTKRIVNRYMRTEVSYYHPKTANGTTGSGGGGHHYYSSMQTKFGLFQAHLQLRILCNHGTYQKLLSWKKESKDARELATQEAREAFIKEIGMGLEIRCDGCKQPRPLINSTHDDRKQFKEDCKHVLCADCLQDCIDLEHCPLCQRYGLVPLQQDDGARRGGGEDGDVDMHDDHDHPHAREAVDAEGDDSDDNVDDGHRVNQHHKDYFNPVGFSTKMNQLMDDVKVDLGTSKSIIFSCWTRTLDLIAKHLAAKKIKYLRIDGECLLSRRQKIIDRFEEEDGRRVLLMTTGTGAFGLNLTAANRIFIVEPQWNPSVENQAIARAIRLLQTEEVKVTRYFIKDTVEDEMRSQQKRKQQVAQVGFVRPEAADTNENERAQQQETEVVQENQPTPPRHVVDMTVQWT